MATIHSFEDLLIWQKAIDLSVEIYRATARFPKEEMFGLTSQLRRASNSVSLNIAEGTAKSTATYVYQLVNARGSAAEVLSGSILAQRLGFMDQSNVSTIRSMVDTESKMLNSLITTLKSK